MITILYYLQSAYRVTDLPGIQRDVVCSSLTKACCLYGSIVVENAYIIKGRTVCRPLTHTAKTRTRQKSKTPGNGFRSYRVEAPTRFELVIKVLQTSALPLGYGANEIKRKKWSGLRGSNSLPPPWQGGALPDELNPLSWCLRSESNQRHEDFQSSALPTELQRQNGDPDGARTHDL